MRDSFEYRPALVVYLDILGFRQLIKQSENDPHKIYEISKILEMMKEQMSKDGRGPIQHTGKTFPEAVFRSLNFSDLTVRVTFTDRGARLVDVLNNEFRSLAEKQCALFCRHGLLLRGGISLGKICMDPEEFNLDDIIYGPALIRSYELESKKALFPRIIIDRDALLLPQPDAKDFWGQLLAQDQDGEYFINYLATCFMDWQCPGSVIVNTQETMANHKAMLESKLSEIKAEHIDDRIADKYYWLANYHNWTVGQLPAPEPDPNSNLFGSVGEKQFANKNKANRDALLLPEDLLPTVFQE